MHIMTLYTQIDMYEYIYYARVLNSVLCRQYLYMYMHLQVYTVHGHIHVHVHVHSLHAGA